MSNDYYIAKEEETQGLSLKEVGDHIVELYEHGNLIARFSQTGVTPENILKVAEETMKGKEN